MTAVPAPVAAVVEQYRLASDLAAQRRNAAVFSAGRDKSRLVDSYWQEAHDAEQRYLTALIVASAFEADPP
jgi:hypothetical protein